MSPLVDAPAGRGLISLAPTTAFWFADSRRAILSNTYLPLDTARDERDRTERTQAAALAMVDLSTHYVQPVTHITQSKFGGKEWYRVSDFLWDEAKSQITLTYAGTGDNAGVPPPETYGLKSEKWVKIALPNLQPSGNSDSDIELTVYQDLNQPPVLSGRSPGSESASILWDPNSQLADLSMGKTSLYRWQDKDGNSWSGLLALPRNYDSKVRYPLVIQTHGYEAGRFFVDGKYTTGSGGMALVAKGIVVLQMDMSMTNFGTSRDGSFAIAGFESAIEDLAVTGRVDRQRVGVIGFSYTCFHVLYALTRRPDLFAAASVTDGNNMSYVQYIMSTDTQNGFQVSGLQAMSENTNGGPPFGKGLSTWFQSAPNFNLDKVKAPLLVSSFETGELIAQWETYSGMRRLEKPVDMLWWRKENTPHILVQPAQRYASQQSSVDWFTYWLKGEEDAGPTKAEQYTRWRKLRELQAKAQKAPGQETN